ncbi:MAG: sigma-70 family RNA polymerase sigma factor [Phycisphaerae bacterium]
MTPTDRAPNPGGPPAQFAVTRWSMVLAAGNWRAGSTARRAMDELARLYWFPLYAYLRRRGNSPVAAEDLVQGFFTHLLDKDALAAVDRTKGKFRSFLLASLQNYLANVWDQQHTAKRGGDQTILALDTMDAEARYAVEPVDTMTPERVYERRWALAVLEQVLERLRGDYQQRGQGELFTVLEPVLVGGAGTRYAGLATQLNMTEAAVKVAAHRLRRRYRELLRAEIAQTVAEPDLVEEELRELLASL